MLEFWEHNEFSVEGSHT